MGKASRVKRERRAAASMQTKPQSNTWRSKLGNALASCFKWVWDWPVVSTLAVLIYGLGAAALFGEEYFISATLFFVAVALVTVKLVSWGEIRQHENKNLLSFIFLALGIIIFLASFGWIWYRAKSMTHPAPKDPHALSLSFLSQPDFHPISDQIGGLLWNDSYVYTTITISNLSSVDLKNIHAHLETDHSFAKITQLTSIPSTLRPTCPSPAVASTWKSSFGVETKQIDTLGVNGVDNSGLFITNGYDISIEKLSANDYITFLVAATDMDTTEGSHFGLDKNMALEGRRAEIKFARILGTYEVPIAPGKSDNDVYHFDVSRGNRPENFSINSIQLPNKTLQAISGPFATLLQHCPAI